MKAIKLFPVVLLICCVFVSCRNANKTAERLADSSSLGDRADSAAKADTLPNAKDETNQSKIDDDGAAFMKTAALGSKMEIELGKVAMEKATHTEVKEFAAKMVADHTMASSDLIKIAQNSGILLPSEYPADVKAHMEAMKKLNGAAFDQHYMEMMVQDHVKTLNLFKSAANLRDDVLRDFVIKTLPVLETHHKLAEDIYSSLK